MITTFLFAKDFKITFLGAIKMHAILNFAQQFRNISHLLSTERENIRYRDNMKVSLRLDKTFKLLFLRAVDLKLHLLDRTTSLYL